MKKSEEKFIELLRKKNMYEIFKEVETEVSILHHIIAVRHQLSLGRTIKLVNPFIRKICKENGRIWEK